jgi:hypothetical protein
MLRVNTRNKGGVGCVYVFWPGGGGAGAGGRGGGGAHRWAEAQRRVPAVRRLYPVFTLYLSYLKPNPRDYVCMGTAFVLA